MVVGGNGSGKSAGIAKPTLKTWQGPICATDVKGELSLCYEELSDQGLVTRPYLVFDPTQPEGPGYDPLWLLSHDGQSPQQRQGNCHGNRSSFARGQAALLGRNGTGGSCGGTPLLFQTWIEFQ